MGSPRTFIVSAIASVVLFAGSATGFSPIPRFNAAFAVPWTPSLRPSVAPLLRMQSHEGKPVVQTRANVHHEEILAPLEREAREFRIKREPLPGQVFKSGVGVIAFIKNPNHPGKILLGKRKGGSGEGTWSLPGGHLEVGESFEECALREVEEETALDLQNAIDLSDRFHYVVIFVTAETSEEPVNIEEDRCEGWEWIDWKTEDFPSPLFTPLANLRDEGFDPFAV